MDAQLAALPSWGPKSIRESLYGEPHEAVLRGCLSIRKPLGLLVWLALNGPVVSSWFGISASAAMAEK